MILIAIGFYSMQFKLFLFFLISLCVIIFDKLRTLSCFWNDSFAKKRTGKKSKSKRQYLDKEKWDNIFFLTRQMKRLSNEIWKKKWYAQTIEKSVLFHWISGSDQNGIETDLTWSTTVKKNKEIYLSITFTLNQFVWIEIRIMKSTHLIMYV